MTWSDWGLGCFEISLGMCDLTFMLTFTLCFGICDGDYDLDFWQSWKLVALVAWKFE